MNYYQVPTAESSAQAVILANGDFPTHHIPLSILQNNQEKLICCDGAANNLINQGLSPQAIIGDCDSLSTENQLRYKKIITKIPDQNTNDLTKAVLFCHEKSISSLIIIGATGKREDHAIANIGLLIKYLPLIDKVIMITDFGYFRAIQEPSKFQSVIGQQVSLFSLHPTIISTTNLKYALNKQTFDTWWQGTLNESLCDHFVLDVNKPLIVYQAF